jgi:hypothetical protein
LTLPSDGGVEALARQVRLFVFQRSADTTYVPQAPEIAEALGQPVASVQSALRHLAANRMLTLASHDASIWAANPFCAVPSGFHVDIGERRYRAICIWDALGIPAALGADARIRALCGDCGDPLELEVRQGRLTRQEGVIHFAVPARHWWDNIGFT